jgi:death-on-curing protein
MEPFWLNIEDCLNIHDKSLEHFGGADGIRDSGLLESALARPQQLFHYEKATLYELAACYAYGLIKNHPFIDGNKRTGYIACALFLQSNGLLLIASEEDALAHTVALAASQIKEKDYANWLSNSCEEV